MEWSGVGGRRWSGVEWSGWKEVEWSGVEWVEGGGGSMHLICEVYCADADAGGFEDGVAAARLYGVLRQPHELRRHEHNVEYGLADLRVPVRGAWVEDECGWGGQQLRVQVAEVLGELGDVLRQALVCVAQAAVQVCDAVERVAAHVFVNGSVGQALAKQTRDLDLHVPVHAVLQYFCMSRARALDHAVGHARHCHRRRHH